MIGVQSDPSPSHIKDRNNGILQAVYNLSIALPEFGFEYVDDPRAAHLFAHHAGAANGMPVTVAHCHGLIPTAMQSMSGGADGINAAVIDNIMRAKAVTVPSEWVADQLRRDMRLEPFVVPWGISHEEWKPDGEDRGYVLWGKGRSDLVCNPTYMNALAKLAPDIQFVSTFGEPTPNVTIIGQQPFYAMRDLVKNASLYLATTRETFGIQTLEAMACGVPVLGFNWAGTPDIVEPWITGWLVEPENIQELLSGLRYCLKNRKELGENCIEEAARYTWQETARQMAEVYQFSIRAYDGPEISVIVPCYNYAQYVEEAIRSVLRQNLPCSVELIVVNDGSTDNSGEVIDRLARELGFQVIHKENGGVSSARMAGFRASHGKFVVFLDADDRIGDRFLKVNWDAMRKDDRLGVSYTPLQLLTPQGLKGAPWPPHTVDYMRLVRGFNQVPTCCMIRRTAFERSGGYRARFEPTEDGELWARIAEIGYTIECATRTPLFTYRLGHPSLSRGVPLPDYVGWHLPARLGHPYCGLPKPGGNYGVRDYDRPVFSIVIAHQADGEPERLYETVDSILAQSYMFWECYLAYPDKAFDKLPDISCYPFLRLDPCSKDELSNLYWVGVENSHAPLIVLVESGVILDGRFLEAALRQWQDGNRQPGIMPRVWYNGFSEKEKELWLAGADVEEVLLTNREDVSKR